jgi:hypothetical protein
MHRSQSVHFQPHRSQARFGGISHWHLPIKLLGSEPGGEADEFGPGNQIGCGHDDFRPGVGSVGGPINGG